MLGRLTFLSVNTNSFHPPERGYGPETGRPGLLALIIPRSFPIVTAYFMNFFWFYAQSAVMSAAVVMAAAGVTALVMVSAGMPLTPWSAWWLRPVLLGS